MGADDSTPSIPFFERLIDGDPCYQRAVDQLGLAEDDGVQLLLPEEVVDAVLLPFLVEAADVLIEQGHLQSRILYSNAAAIDDVFN